ncbi:50S ribosomal protein L4 [Alphaproteobacteria bacterium]
MPAVCGWYKDGICMKAQVISLDSDVTGSVELSQGVFGRSIRPDLMHRVVLWQRSKRRAGTHKTKEIGDIRGSTRKIYKQKGTGQARHGSLRAPQFRGGAVIFGPVVRSHEFKLNKKVRVLGVVSALSLKYKEGDLIVLQDTNLASFKTGYLLDRIRNMGLEKSTMLIIDQEISDNLKMSTANLRSIDVMPVEGMNVFDILRHKKLVLTINAIKQIEKRLII